MEKRWCLVQQQRGNIRLQGESQTANAGYVLLRINWLSRFQRHRRTEHFGPELKLSHATRISRLPMEQFGPGLICGAFCAEFRRFVLCDCFTTGSEIWNQDPPRYAVNR